MLHDLLNIWFTWVQDWGYWGVIILMAMESSIFPVPSEVVMPPAAFLAAQGKMDIWGVILGALLLSFVPEVLRYTVEPLQKAAFGRMLVEPEVLRMLVFGFALVLVMLFRPAGLLPSAVRKRELAEKKA